MNKREKERKIRANRFLNEKKDIKGVTCQSDKAKSEIIDALPPSLISTQEKVNLNSLNLHTTFPLRQTLTLSQPISVLLTPPLSLPQPVVQQIALPLPKSSNDTPKIYEERLLTTPVTTKFLGSTEHSVQEKTRSLTDELRHQLGLESRADYLNGNGNSNYPKFFGSCVPNLSSAISNDDDTNVIALTCDSNIDAVISDTDNVEKDIDNNNWEFNIDYHDKLELERFQMMEDLLSQRKLHSNLSW